MKRGYKSSLGLIAKVLIILLLPLLMFRYVDSHPTSIAKDDDEDKGTRSVAVVNEDMGYDSGTEDISLGQDITSLLNDQDDYSWVVMNRSAAEQGFSNQTYDAIIYVPSNFSENVMTFKDESPSKASINYVIQPNLEAKERQRIHREMANAKNTINQEMSTIYWNYVSQEVDIIREEFDKVLEKEIAFQDAMYSFYTPSSETLANEIDNHKNRLEGILDQTQRVDEVSTDSANSATEAENKISQFTEALDAYKESQFEQQQLLGEFQAENKLAVQEGVTGYKEAVENYLAEIDEQIRKYESPVYRQDEKLEHINQRFSMINSSLNNGKHEFDKWNKSGNDNLRGQIITLNVAFLNEYNSRMTLESKDEVLYTIENYLTDKGEDDHKKPDEYTPESLDFEKIYNDVQSVRVAVEQLEDIIGDSIDDSDTGGEEEPNPESEKDVENVEDEKDEKDEKDEEDEEAGNSEVQNNVVSSPNNSTIKINWDTVYEELDKLDGENGTIDTLKSEFESEKNSWEKHIKAWEEAYEELEKVRGQVSTPLIEQIEEQQNDILNSDKLPEVLNSDEIAVLEEAFLDKSELENKKILSLSIYTSDLSTLSNNLTERAKINRQLVRKVFASEIMQEELEKMYDLDSDLTKELKGMFDQLVDEDESIGAITKLAENFDLLVDETNEFLDEYDEKVYNELNEITNTIDELKNDANSIAEQISEINNEIYDWEESPSLEYLDGQMVFQYQQGTASNLDSLSDLVSSLGENQNNITSDTKELQSKVSSVQERSDELNNRWSTNVSTTEQIRDDVYDVLGNTVVDGQSNPYVYDYLANPVNVEGQVDGKVLSETEDRMPPVVLFIIILLCGLLIGFLTQYYSGNSYLVQGGLFVLLNLAVGMIISIYGLNIYPLDDSQAIMWSAFTILLLMACSNIIRGGLFVGPFVGWLASIAMIIFFISPLLNIIVPEFSFNNPVSNVYMGLLYGASSSYAVTMTVLAGVVLIVSAFIYALQVMRNKTKVEEPNEEKAS